MKQAIAYTIRIILFWTAQQSEILNTSTCTRHIFENFPIALGLSRPLLVPALA